MIAEINSDINLVINGVDEKYVIEGFNVDRDFHLSYSSPFIYKATISGTYENSETRFEHSFHISDFDMVKQDDLIVIEIKVDKNIHDYLRTVLSKVLIRPC